MFIAISNQKGGVAKTTTAINLSASISAAGMRVLLIDSDPQGNATMGSGVNKLKIKNSLYQVMSEDLHISKAIIASPAGYDLLPANADLTAATVELLKRQHRQKILREAIDPIRDQYDYIFCDCPPALNILTLNAFVAADRLLVPIQCEYFSLEGLSDLLQTQSSIKKALNPNLEIEGFVRTLFDKRNSLSQEVSMQLIKRFGDKVYNTVITRNVRLAEAPSHGLPIMQYDRHSTGAQNYYALAGEMLRRHKIIPSN